MLHQLAPSADEVVVHAELKGTTHNLHGYVDLKSPWTLTLKDADTVIHDHEGSILIDIKLSESNGNWRTRLKVVLTRIKIMFLLWKGVDVEVIENNIRSSILRYRES